MVRLLSQCSNARKSCVALYRALFRVLPMIWDETRDWIFRLLPLLTIGTDPIPAAFLMKLFVMLMKLLWYDPLTVQSAIEGTEKKREKQCTNPL